MIPRRTLLMLSAILMAGSLFAMGGLGIEDPVPSAKKRGIVGLITIFGVSFSLGWAPLTYVVATEVSPLKLRDHSARLGFTVNVVIK